MMAKMVVSEIEETVSITTAQKNSDVENTTQTPMSVRKRFSLLKCEKKQAHTANNTFSESCFRCIWMRR